METAEKLKEGFHKLSNEEKLNFIKSIAPEICQAFMENREELMGEMMPFCMNAMNTGKMDMNKMKSMWKDMMSNCQ